MSTNGAAERRRIDVHHHIAPPAYLAEVGPDINPPLKSWSLAKAVEDMDEGNVATAIVSITQIAMRLTDRERIRRLARACNEYAARMVAEHKGRFGMFVALPLPDIDASLKEIEYGLDQLKADGVGLYTSYHDKWLGDPLFEPIFAELNRRKAVSYVHPAVPDCCRNIVPGVGDAAIEYGTDTTRAIARMVFSGTAQRFPDARMIWSHAGGTMPFLIERFTRMAESPEYAAQLPQGFCMRHTASSTTRRRRRTATRFRPRGSSSRLRASCSAPTIPTAPPPSMSRASRRAACSTPPSSAPSTATISPDF